MDFVMRKFFFLLLFFVVINVYVVYVDVCYEYFDDSKVNYDCVYIFYWFVNGVGFVIEVILKLGGDDINKVFNDLEI